MYCMSYFCFVSFSCFYKLKSVVIALLEFCVDCQAFLSAQANFLLSKCFIIVPSCQVEVFRYVQTAIIFTILLFIL